MKWLERPNVNWSNLLISKAYFAANKMNLDLTSQIRRVYLIVDVC